MQLKNPFPLSVRNLYLYHSYECWICGGNGVRKGGMSLHHIWGRVSSSALNSAPLCGECHSHVGHTREERIYLLSKTMSFLLKERYKLKEEDNSFLEMVKDDLRGFKIL